MELIGENRHAPGLRPARSPVPCARPDKYAFPPRALRSTGKGNETGAVWVASRVPEGSICSHANQAPGPPSRPRTHAPPSLRRRRCRRRRRLLPENVGVRTPLERACRLSPRPALGGWVLLQARTRHVKWDDPETVLYSKDVMTFAQKKGYFPKDGKAEDFSFVGAYGAGPFPPLPVRSRGLAVCLTV